MIERLHAGFDTLDVAFAGALPDEALETLKEARDRAQESQEPTLARLGTVDMHVAGHGMRGGYAYVCDTGPLGAKWMVKANPDTREWNIFASPRATTLLALGHAGTRDHLFSELAAMGARISDHSLNRVDFAMDFRTRCFEPRLDQFVAHAHTKVQPHWGDRRAVPTDRNQPAAVVRGRRLESVTIGKQPGRQVILYDKRREAIARQKGFWFEAWGVDRRDPALEVWRVEVRAGKKELRDKYQLRTFADFEAGIGDVIANALQEVRYLADHQRDGNVTRQALHPLWQAAQEVAGGDLTALRSGLTPGQVQQIERAEAIERYVKLLQGIGIGLGVAEGLSDEAITTHLPTLAAERLKAGIEGGGSHVTAAIARARARLYFVGPKPL
ncbi:hypothetical protein [Roseospirillum parvum]|uniref:Replication initiation factor n=1 Tax=Roseospirillum parvum TaxID=83401 RepID=A0A1G8B481_9PROT|nr:hypothetical protein [Roseospirillum parvum]SDH27450.1 hypothetical protein SAMN05421742_105189 [Roseospirillum parvum]